MKTKDMFTQLFLILLIYAGAACFVVAGFKLHPAAGCFTLGVAIFSLVLINAWSLNIIGGKK